MKITRIEPIHVAIPFDQGAPAPVEGLGAGGTLDIVFVRVDTDEGITGWGEAFSPAGAPVMITALTRIIAPIAVGRPADDVAMLMRDLFFRTKGMSRNGPVAYALSGLDIALWDIKGKAERKPIWQLLGGAPKSHVPAYASLLRLRAHVGPVAAQAADAGFRHIKLHEHDATAVHAARAAIDDHVALMVDVNCYWPTVDAALAAARTMADENLTWLEEPIYPPDDFTEYARLRRAGVVPIAGGENLGNVMDVNRMCEARAVDVVQPSLAKMGGITEMMKAIAGARERGVRLVPHSPYSGPALVATVHVIAAAGGDMLCEHRYCELAASPFTDWPDIRDGTMRVPEAPGLGVGIDEPVIERYRVA
jgi:L-alanine-DL-glutamate epimerase-like enolase superfamily enzyme